MTEEQKAKLLSYKRWNINAINCLKKTSNCCGSILDDYQLLRRMVAKELNYLFKYTDDESPYIDMTITPLDKPYVTCNKDIYSLARELAEKLQLSIILYYIDILQFYVNGFVEPYHYQPRNDIIIDEICKILNRRIKNEN